VASTVASQPEGRGFNSQSGCSFYPHLWALQHKMYILTAIPRIHCGRSEFIGPWLRSLRPSSVHSFHGGSPRGKSSSGAAKRFYL